MTFVMFIDAPEKHVRDLLQLRNHFLGRKAKLGRDCKRGSHQDTRLRQFSTGKHAQLLRQIRTAQRPSQVIGIVANRCPTLLFIVIDDVARAIDASCP